MNPPPDIQVGQQGAAIPPPPGVVLPSPALEHARRRGRVRTALPLLGPAFVAAVAYVDPGNFATNNSGGARYGFLLVWVIVAANLMAMLVQYLSAKIGIASGRTLPELCPEAFPRPVTWGLWLQADRDRDRDRPRRVRRRGDRSQPAVRRAAFRGRPDDGGRRVRDSGASEPRLPPLRARHRRPAQDRFPRLRLRPQLRGRGPRRARRRPDPWLRRDRQRASRRGHPRRHGHAARRVPALGSHEQPHSGRLGRRAAPAASLPAAGRAARDGPRRSDQT
jgi:hypothetical protein